MNAQKAIAVGEEKIKRIEEIKEAMEDDNYTDNLSYSRICERLEAFKILIESAKLLHGEGIHTNINASNYVVIERDVYREDFEKLGIEGEADE